MKPKSSHQSNENFPLTNQFPDIWSIVGKSQNFYDKAKIPGFLYAEIFPVSAHVLPAWYGQVERQDKEFFLPFKSLFCKTEGFLKDCAFQALLLFKSLFYPDAAICCEISSS